jgi:hypothetical protein
MTKESFWLSWLLLFVMVALVSCTTSQLASAPVTTGSAPTSPVVTKTPIASPTPTPALAPVVLPNAWLYILDLTDNVQAPSDLAEHLFFYRPGGAGGDGNQAEHRTAYWVMSYKDSIKPAVPNGLGWLACSLSVTTVPQAMLVFPDGTTLNLEVEMETETCASIHYDIVPGAQLGAYTIQLKQGDTELRDTVTLELPVKPIHADYQHRDWFAGFQPGETVSVSVYSDDDIFNQHSQTEKKVLYRRDSALFFLVDQQMITADQYGSFQIGIKTPSAFKGGIYISVHGDKSGTLSKNPEGEGDGWIEGAWLEKCSEPIQLKIGDTARVTDYLNPLPSIEGYMKHLRVFLPAGTTVKVLDGPFCVDGHWAWLVETLDQTQLVLSEGTAKDHYLEPVKP